VYQHRSTDTYKGKGKEKKKEFFKKGKKKREGKETHPITP
jgi:hypothetical protein